MQKLAKAGTTVTEDWTFCEQNGNSQEKQVSIFERADIEGIANNPYNDISLHILL